MNHKKVYHNKETNTNETLPLKQVICVSNYINVVFNQMHIEIHQENSTFKNAKVYLSFPEKKNYIILKNHKK